MYLKSSSALYAISAPSGEKLSALSPMSTLLVRRSTLPLAISSR
jgi:hypothetical protein